MHEAPVETLFARFADTGDPDALAAVFDQLAGKLLLVAAHLDGGADFPWPIGLLAGTYKLGFDMYGEAKGSTTVVVGTEPLQIDLQLAK